MSYSGKDIANGVRVVKETIEARSQQRGQELADKAIANVDTQGGFWTWFFRIIGRIYAYFAICVVIAIGLSLFIHAGLSVLISAIASIFILKKSEAWNHPYKVTLGCIFILVILENTIGGIFNLL